MAAAGVPTAAAARLHDARGGRRPRSTSSGRRTSSRTTGSPRARASSSPTTATRRSPTPPRASGSSIEEFLDGPEVSLFAITDGTDGLPAAAGAGLQADPRRRRRTEHRRHGRLHAAAVGAAGPGRRGRSHRAPARPSTRWRRRGTPFAGLLYAGLALTSRGVRVVEFNARFGDPETQAAAGAARLAARPSCCSAAADRDARRGRPALRWRDGAAVTVVMASAGYPESSTQGRRRSRASTLAEARRRRTSSTPARRWRGRLARHRRRPGARRDRGRRRPGRAPAPAPTRASRRSASPARSAAPTSPLTSRGAAGGSPSIASHGAGLGHWTS